MGLQFSFYKVFRMGQKTGQVAKNATCTVTADNEQEARKLAAASLKDKVEYTIVVTEVDEFVSSQSVSESDAEVDLRTGSDPASWKKGDTCWYKTSPYEDGYVMGQVTDLAFSPKHGPALQVYSEVGGFRTIVVADVRRKAPRGEIKRTKQVDLTRDMESFLHPVGPVGKMRRKEGN